MRPTNGYIYFDQCVPWDFWEGATPQTRRANFATPSEI